MGKDETYWGKKKKKKVWFTTCVRDLVYNKTNRVKKTWTNLDYK